MSLDLTESIKTLGLHWNPRSDTITYITNISDTNQKGTKHAIFSQIAKLFDPLGLLGHNCHSKVNYTKFMERTTGLG